MFDVHFHFSESYADWFQVIISAIGLYFIYQTIRQGNENLQMQILARRSSSRAVFKVIDEGVDLYKVPGAIVSFKIECTKNDAIDLRIYFPDFSQLLYVDAGGNQIPTIENTRTEHKHFPIWVLRSEKADPDDVDMIFIIVTFADESGYWYQQSIMVHLGHEIKFGSVQFLDNEPNSKIAKKSWLKSLLRWLNT
jgi:hypothetical protein